METTTIVSIALTVLFGVLSVVFYLRGRRHRRLTFTFEQSELHTRTHPEVRITFRDRDVTNLSRLRAVCWNSGTQEIRGEDLPDQGSPTVLFSGATVLSVACVDPTPDTHFRAEQRDQHSVSVGFSFLNPGDCGLFEVLYEAEPSETPEVRFVARVIGGRPTDTRSFSGSLTIAESVAAFSPPVACVLAMYLSLGYIRDSIQRVPDGFTISFAAVGVVLLLFIGIVAAVMVAWRYARRVRESRIPASAKEFLKGNRR
jgi:hypothetical protein